jgi:hypothetical protein
MLDDDRAKIGAADTATINRHVLHGFQRIAELRLALDRDRARIDALEAAKPAACACRDLVRQSLDRLDRAIARIAALEAQPPGPPLAAATKPDPERIPPGRRRRGRPLGSPNKRTLQRRAAAGREARP